MSNIIVLGAGMVGSAMARDLAKNHSVTTADISEERLKELTVKSPSVNTLQLDISDKESLKKAIGRFDVVLNAVPGFMGFETLKTIIEAGKNTVDISFFPENSLELHELAQKNRVTAVTDCGVAPGMGNIILGRYNEEMKISSFECYVGGLPKKRKKPFEYKAPFSPVDVIEEYTRPARYKINGDTVVRPALSEVESMHFDQIGTLEAFNTDGLRSLLYTMPHIPNMKEKTLRYPGHIEYISVLKEAGFFDTKTITVNGNAVKPLDFTSKILFSEWKLGDWEEEFTVMRIIVEGEENGKLRKIRYDLFDEFDQESGISSMARTTGYTATAAVNLISEGLFTEKGIFPPELVGKHKLCFDFMMNYLEERGVVYTKKDTQHS